MLNETRPVPPRYTISDFFSSLLDSLAKISPSPFLNLGVRTVSAHFWRSRLYSLIFDLNVRSIQTVLTPFKQIYGSPTLIVMDDPADPLKLTYLYWVEHGIGLQVLLSHSAGEVVQKNSAQNLQTNA